MTLRTATAAASFRRDSEDRAAVHAVPGGVVVVVADGAGGIPGGAAAAERVLALVADTVARASVDPRDGEAWCGLLREADAMVDADPACGEATAVVVAVFEYWRVVGASAGDSGAVVVGARGAVDDLAAGQRRKRRVGGGRAAPVAFDRARLEGTLVVASDGLLAYVPRDAIARAAIEAPLDRAAACLVDHARTPRSRDLVDDVVVVLVRRDA